RWSIGKRIKVDSFMPRTSNSRFGLLGVQPVVDLLACQVLTDTVAFLNLPFKLFAPSIDLAQIIVGKIAPLFLDLAFQLLPVSCDAIPIHCHHYRPTGGWTLARWSLSESKAAGQSEYRSGQKELF